MKYKFITLAIFILLSVITTSIFYYKNELTELYYFLSSNTADVKVLQASDIPIFETFPWIDSEKRGNGQQLLLRRLDSNPDILLIGNSHHNLAYRYNLKSMAFKEALNSEWANSHTTISECGKQFKLPIVTIRPEVRTRRLKNGDKFVSTIGQKTISMTMSPSEKWVSVLSTDGTLRQSMLPFMGGSYVNGQHYHQIFSLPNMEPFGKPIAVNTGEGNDIIHACWSSDEGVVIYFDILNARLLIIETMIPHDSTNLKDMQ